MSKSTDISFTQKLNDKDSTSDPREMSSRMSPEDQRTVS